ncbi:hypothetical protein IWX49DRAFT_589180 [Phyllosticta citricarpa]|uniref:Uncharacterized protein n=2 Tax=Phyllosticta TaxID=121621 RepID=A0ABR1M6U3_9PEZI
MHPNLVLLLVLAIVGAIGLVSVFFWKRLAIARMQRYRANMELREQVRAAVRSSGRTATAAAGSTQKPTSDAIHASPVRGRVRFKDRPNEPSSVSVANATTTFSSTTVVPPPRTPEQSPSKRGSHAGGSPQKSKPGEGMVIVLDPEQMEKDLRPAGLKWNKAAPSAAAPSETSSTKESTPKESPVKTSPSSKTSAAKDSPIKVSATNDSAGKPAPIKLSPIKKTSTAKEQPKTTPTKASTTKKPAVEKSATKQSPVKSSTTKEPTSKESSRKSSPTKSSMVKQSSANAPPPKSPEKQVTFSNRLIATQPDKSKSDPAPASPTKSKKSSSNGSPVGFAGMEVFGGGNYDQTEQGRQQW